MLAIRNLLYICGPNEVLVFSGAPAPTAAATVTVKGGRAGGCPSSSASTASTSRT
jgi:hypothetical protein